MSRHYSRSAERIRPTESLPLTGQAAEDYLRATEAAVLDRAGIGADFWTVPRAFQIYAILAAFDSMFLVMKRPDCKGTLGHAQVTKYMTEGFVEALRWVTQEARSISFQSTSEQRFIECGGDLLMLASHYWAVAHKHQMYWKGLVAVEADSERRIVRFPFKSKNHPSVGPLQLADLARSDHARMSRAPIEEIWAKTGANAIVAQPEFVNGRIVFQSPGALGDKVAPLLASDDIDELAPLPGTTDLAGFTIAELSRFMGYLRAWSRAALRVYSDSFDCGVAQVECMPTQAVGIDVFLGAASDATGLRLEVLIEIMDRLTYDPSDRKRDVFLRPLLRIGGLVVWSPLAIEFTRALRNVLKGMARSDKYRDFTATLIGRREAPLLGAVESVLRKTGPYIFVRNVRINSGTANTEVDLLAYSLQAPKQVLVVQVKAGLAADDLGEVRSATRDMQHGQDQATESIRGIQQMSLEERERLVPVLPWCKIEKYFAIVVSSANEPDSFFDHSRVPGISLRVLVDNLTRDECSTPYSLVRACRARKWQPRLDGLEEVFTEIRIGDVTYQMPQFDVEIVL
jgi:hypothetical protein